MNAIPEFKPAYGTPIPKKNAVAVRERAQGYCEFQYPGCLQTQCLEIDHIKSRARGGSHEVHNLALVCRKCHEKKTKNDPCSTNHRTHGWQPEGIGEDEQPVTLRRPNGATYRTREDAPIDAEVPTPEAQASEQKAPEIFKTVIAPVKGRMVIPGKPQAWDRPGQNGFMRFDTTKNQSMKKVYCSYAYDSGLIQAIGGRPWDGPVRMDVIAYFQRPKRLMRKNDPEGPIICLARPDRDNILKLIKDAYNEVLYRDDAQVYDGRMAKFYCEKDKGPRVEIEIEFL